MRWYLTVELLALPRFRALPGPTEVAAEWFAPDPSYGTSVFTPVYYDHILASVRRVGIAFLAGAGDSASRWGWRSAGRRGSGEYAFPVFELIRPIPILAWVPAGDPHVPQQRGSGDLPDLPGGLLRHDAQHDARRRSRSTRTCVRAARCLGARPLDVVRDGGLPGALPYLFTGLQIAMGVAWFSLVAGEMIAGRLGLGYLINSSYTTTRYPTIVIAMITLGLVGFASSALDPPGRQPADGLPRRGAAS